MQQSLVLSLYSLAARRRNEPTPAWPARPAGQLVWLHAPGQGSYRGLLELGRRLRDEDGYQAVLTSPEETGLQSGVPNVRPPPETPAAVRAFFDHWRPDVAVLADGELRPVLMAEAARRKVPVFLVDAREPYLPGPAPGWWPGLARSALSHVDRVVAVDAAAARNFERLGAETGRLRADGRMEEGSSVLPCLEAERAALVRQFETRPVWLAAALPEAEEAAVITAHRAALRLSHRLLLILVPDRAERAEELAQSLQANEGWTVALRNSDEEPDSETEVFIVSAAEMGLWYRLAPITYLGGSLYGTGSQRDPMEPAALGSAILHGPRAGDWSGAHARLTAAKATRLVNSPSELAEGLTDLLSPDRAARLAQAAWGVASAGAEVTDRILMMLRETLEKRA